MEDNRLTFRRLLALYAQYAKMDFAWLLRDTGACLLAILSDLVANIASLSGVFLLTLRFENFSDMSQNEVLFMLGYLITAAGISEVFFRGCNVLPISRRIGRGQLEHMFLQPLPLPVQLLTEGFLPFSGNSSLICGLLLLGASFQRLQLQATAWWVAAFVGSQLVSIATLLGLSYLVSCTAFYAPVSCEEISASLLDITDTLKNFPLSGMSITMQVGLVTLLPTGLLGWFPCLILLERPPLGLSSWYPLLFCALLYLVTYFFFRKGLQYYIRTGINRYSSIGHRS